MGLLNGYNAGVGYDLATGLGTLNVANVVNGWTAATGSETAIVTVTPTPGSIVGNQTMSIKVTVSGASRDAYRNRFRYRWRIQLRNAAVNLRKLHIHGSGKYADRWIRYLTGEL